MKFLNLSLPPQLLLLLACTMLALCSSGVSSEGKTRMVQFGSLLIPVKAGNSRSAEEKDNRAGKSLLNTFPFNARGDHSQSHAHHGHHDHGDDHHDHQAHARHHQEPARASRQGASNDVSLDIGSIAAAGERCIDKVVMTEETEYDTVIECKHSYTERCFSTYKTDYEPQQEEECDENFRKNCFIEFKKVAVDEKVKFCFTPLVKNCNIPGPEECTTEYQTVCSTRYHEHDVEEDVPDCVDEEEVKCEDVTQGYTTEEKCSRWPVKRCSLQKKQVKKYTPETDCQKVPFELCGPASCPVEPGPEECQDKTETIVQEKPEEVCTLEPQRECKHVTKLVPLLKAVEECVDIPKEVCSRQRRNPRRVQKPIVKKWCYLPTEESGLSTSDSLSQANQNQYKPPPPVQKQEEYGCLRGRPVDYCPRRANNGRCDPECDTPACGYDANECVVTTTTTTPRPGCARGYAPDHCPNLSRNGVCNPECNTARCFYDGGDCKVEEPELGYLPPVGAPLKRRNGY